ncbi:FAD-dependent sensor of blue light [Palleronia aestuarii]|uniref:FAD-dependent sensor of blue light n=1 Tax=Palleronia aestuarii TaxID=568105 RepID=A0A2W7NBI6_9RHOB|nr:BLUF domain-containing protein [Palleronia aestuarii]PZX17498.1 FAD-dependent sensor of blue light [Palleronia aestuarii]
MNNTLMHCLYVSRALVPADAAEAASIYGSARQRNPQLDVTGYLHREGPYFAQYIEGPGYAIEQLVPLIRDDPRHDRFRILSHGEAETRVFGSWHMAFTDEGMNPYATFAAGSARPTNIAMARAEDLEAFFRASADIIEAENWGGPGPRDEKVMSVRQ